MSGGYLAKAWREAGVSMEVGNKQVTNRRIGKCFYLNELIIFFS